MMHHLVKRVGAAIMILLGLFSLAVLLTSCATCPAESKTVTEEQGETATKPMPNCADPVTQVMALKFLPIVEFILFDATCGKDCDKHLGRLERIHYAATACAAQAANEMHADQQAGK